jgi:hypothetical protein
MYNVLDSNILYNHSAQPDIREGLDITRIWKQNFHDLERRFNTDTFYRSACTKPTSLSPIRRGFAPGFVNYKKGALDS